MLRNMIEEKIILFWNINQAQRALNISGCSDENAIKDYIIQIKYQGKYTFHQTSLTNFNRYIEQIGLN